MLALPGLYGYANHVAFGLLYSRAAGDDRYAISVIWLMLVPPLAVASIVGVVVALDRPGPFRVLAVVANGAYVLLAALLAYHCLWPIF